MTTVTWVLESDVFPETHKPIRHAIQSLGHNLVDWSDAWWENGIPANVQSEPTVFHGSLGNAARIAAELDWSPGSFCPSHSFHCSSWYESARKWLVHARWEIVPACDLVSDARSIAASLSCSSQLFVRPDSPLKPFSGRVIDVENLSLAELDYGFYYDDETLPVVAAPVQVIGQEWRFVVVAGEVIAGSEYDPERRIPISTSLNSAAASFASLIASSLPSPAEVYVLDVCECDGKLRLLELNPFGGADLYACDATSIITAVTDLVLTT